MLSLLVSVVQVQLEDTKKAREDAYEKYVASRLESAVLHQHPIFQYVFDMGDLSCAKKYQPDT